MEGIARAAAIYGMLLVLFRVTGKRSLARITTFDFILLLIIGEATQQALLGNDFSVMNATVVIVTLIVLDLGLSLLKQHSRRFDRILEGDPLLLVENGSFLKEHMDKARVDEQDILEAARALRGLERADQIKFAILERNGEITVIPRRDS
jgi:uncharacterized membrane protein YcaP (DUF421 family)